MKMENTTKTALKYAWTAVMVLLGVLLDTFDIGTRQFSGYSSVGSYLISVGLLGMIVITVSTLRTRKKLVDERMEYVAAKANRMTFLALIVTAFAVMIADGIQPITLPYHLFMSYLVSGLLVVYFISYKILLRYH